ncbi:hypothetical protein [Streptomyces sp. NPDC053048]|uniref:hypothetical protein n=1 Tax=Streptomyces sp. NPDC053048 TaxID=3365694 RepID=UPI0037D87E4B
MTLGVLGVALFGAAVPAHAAPAEDDTLGPARELAGAAADTVCQTDLKNVPVASQYSGVVAGVCNSSL